MRKLIKNSIKCPDGVILTSRHRHDFVSHKDKNGELYYTDGGLSYLKRSVNIKPYEDLSLYTTDSFEKLREGLEWATYGRNGNEELHYKSISNMSSNHIKAILLNCKVADYMKELFEKEIAFRNECKQKGLTESHWEED
jgi:hypothetical protein